MAQSTQLTEEAGESLSEPSAPYTRKPRPQWIALLLLALLSALPYLNTLANDFVYDDHQQIVQNPYVHSFRYVIKIFGSSVWAFQGRQGASNYYRPLMTLTYAMAYHGFGPYPLGFHLLNVGLHVSIVLVLFVLTQRLFQDRLLSLIAAALFALHPIHTESVAWISGITDLEMSLFFLTTLLLYLGGPGNRPAACCGRSIAMVVSYGLSLLSKETALALPVVVIMYECFFRPMRLHDRGMWLRCVPLFLATAAYLIWRSSVLGAFAPMVTRPDLPWSAVLLGAVTLAGQYLCKVVWPTHLTAFYVFQETRNAHDPQFLAGVAALIICMGLFVWFWQHARPASFAFAWMFATLAPVLDARWMPAQVFAERYLYLPSVGFCWVAGWVLARLSQRGRARLQSANPIGWRSLVAVALALIFVLYATIVVRRNRDWRTEEILYRRTLEEEPDAQLIRTSLGIVYADRGDWDAAEHEWTLALGPGRPYPITLNALGVLRQREKRYAEAEALYTEAVQLRPQYAEPHRHLAEMYAEMGRPADSEHEFQFFNSLSQ